MQTRILTLVLVLLSATVCAQINIPVLTGKSGLVLLPSEGNITLDCPRVWGTVTYPIGGDKFIDTTGANKQVAVKILHKDIFPPIFTTDPGVDIYIVQDGNTRLYDPDEALFEYQVGVLNELWVVRDYADGATTEIYITILN